MRYEQSHDFSFLFVCLFLRQVLVMSPGWLKFVPIFMPRASEIWGHRNVPAWLSALPGWDLQGSAHLHSATLFQDLVFVTGEHWVQAVLRRTCPLLSHISFFCSHKHMALLMSVHFLHLFQSLLRGHHILSRQPYDKFAVFFFPSFFLPFFLSSFLLPSFPFFL